MEQFRLFFLIASSGSTDGSNAALNQTVLTTCWHCLCRAGSMKLSSVRLSVYPITRPPQSAAAGLLLLAQWPWDINRLLHGWRSAPNASSVTLSAEHRLVLITVWYTACTCTAWMYTMIHNYGNPWFLLYSLWINRHKVIKFSTYV